MTGQTIQLSLNLNSETLQWLNQTALAANRSLATMIGDFLTVLASPESKQDELIDKLLASAVRYFPAIMELDEQQEMREEVIDFLYSRLIEVSSNSRTPLTQQELSDLRNRLIEQSTQIWSAP